MLRPNLVLLLTDVLLSYLSASLFASASLSPCLRDMASFILSRYRKSRGMSLYTTNGWQARLANLYKWVFISFGALFIRLCATSNKKIFINYNLLLGWVKSFAIFLWRKAQFSSSKFFCWTVRGKARLILSECSLPDLLLWLGARPRNPLLLGLPDLARLSNFLQRSNIFCIIWLLQWDQLHLRFFPNKCFRSLPRRYSQVRTRKAKFPELVYIAPSFVWLLNPTQSEAMQNVSVYQQPRYYQQ